MGHREITIEAEDHVILFLLDKKYVPDVGRLFSVGPTFM